MRNLVIVLVGMAWLMWPGNARALSLGCELPGYEAEQHWPPIPDECREYCRSFYTWKDAWPYCKSGWAYFDMVLEYNVPLDGGWECHWVSSKIRCESPDEYLVGGPYGYDPWGDPWKWF